MSHPTAPTITGPRNTSTGMYLVNLKHMTNTAPVSPTKSKHTINHVYDMRTKVDLATYLHLCAWSPAVDTSLKAINRSAYLTWPGLSSKLIKKHLPKSIPTAKGHLKMSRQNVRSTTPQTATTTPDPTVMMTATSPPGPHVRTHLVTIRCIDLSGKIVTDQTGCFPVTSSRDHK